jgi:hypothetical protein
LFAPDIVYDQPGPQTGLANIDKKIIT